MGKKHGFRFSWKRASGLSAAKGKLSRQIGIPLTRAGRQRKVGKLAGCCVPFLILLFLAIGIPIALAHPGRTDANGGHYDRKSGVYHYHNSGTSGDQDTDSFLDEQMDESAEDNYASPNRSSPQIQRPKYGGYPTTPYIPKGPPKAEGGWAKEKPENKIEQQQPIKLHDDNLFLAYYDKGIYHKSKTCKDLKNELPGGGLSDQLHARGMKPCPLCVPAVVSEVVPKLIPGPADTTVVYTASNIYHLVKACTALTNKQPAPAMMSKAIELKMQRCTICISEVPPQ